MNADKASTVGVFWSYFERYQQASKIDPCRALPELEMAASFPPDISLPALVERARLSFLGGDVSDCAQRLKVALQGCAGSPFWELVRNEMGFLVALSRHALGEDGADEGLALMSARRAHFNERMFQGTTMSRLEAKANPDSQSLIERYLALKKVLHAQNVEWHSVESSITSQDVVLEIGAMDGVTCDPLYNTIRRLNLRGTLVEPLPDMYEELKRNYVGNDRLVFANVAIGENSGFQLIYRVSPDSARSRRLPRWSLGIASFQKPDPLDVFSSTMIPETVRTLTFRDFCGEFGVNRCDLLQIDTEGFDWKILQQMNLQALGCRALRIEFCHLSLADRIAAARHLEVAGFRMTYREGLDLLAVRSGS